MKYRFINEYRKEFAVNVMCRLLLRLRADKVRYPVAPPLALGPRPWPAPRALPGADPHRPGTSPQRLGPKPTDLKGVRFMTIQAAPCLPSPETRGRTSPRSATSRSEPFGSIGFLLPTRPGTERQWCAPCGNRFGFIPRSPFRVGAPGRVDHWSPVPVPVPVRGWP